MSGHRFIKDIFLLTGLQQEARRNPYRAYQRFVDGVNSRTGLEITPLPERKFDIRWGAMNDEGQQQLCDLFCEDIAYVAALVKRNWRSDHRRVLLSQLDDGLYSTLYRTRRLLRPT